MATESDYLVRNAKLVFGYFSELVKNKCIISAHFGEYNASFLTTIVELDQKKNVLALDCGPSDSLNDQLLTSKKVLFRTEVDGIKVSFSGSGIKKVKNGDYWGFSMPIPSSIFWLQRRQFYRVKVPFSHTNSYCQLTFKAQNEEDSDTTVNLSLFDISITGVSFLNPDPKWAEQLQPDTEFVDCTLHLNNNNEARVAFVIKNNVKVRVNNINTQQRIGCLFRQLPPSFESSIQRYMQEIEIQQKSMG